MQEKGIFRRGLETVAKVWTIVSIPVELFLLGHGIATKNAFEAFLGGAGLVGDVFLLKWLNRDQRESKMQTPIASFHPKGSQRLQSVYA